MGCGANSLAKATISSAVTTTGWPSQLSPSWKSSKKRAGMGVLKAVHASARHGRCCVVAVVAPENASATARAQADSWHVPGRGSNAGPAPKLYGNSTISAGAKIPLRGKFEMANCWTARLCRHGAHITQKETTMKHPVIARTLG